MVSQITILTIVYSTVYSRRGWKKASNLHVTDLCAGILPVTNEFPAEKASNAENASIWWRHHVEFCYEDGAWEDPTSHQIRWLIWISAVVCHITGSNVVDGKVRFAFITISEQFDPWIKNQQKITLLLTILPLRGQNFVWCERDSVFLPQMAVILGAAEFFLLVFRDQVDPAHYDVITWKLFPCYWCGAFNGDRQIPLTKGQ